MFRSLSYKGSLGELPDDDPAEAFYDTSDNILIGKEIMSETYYAGDKGDEVSDYSFNFKLGITSNIKSTSVFVYAADSSAPPPPRPPTRCSARSRTRAASWRTTRR